MFNKRFCLCMPSLGMKKFWCIFVMVTSNPATRVELSIDVKTISPYELKGLLIATTIVWFNLQSSKTAAGHWPFSEQFCTMAWQKN